MADNLFIFHSQYWVKCRLAQRFHFAVNRSFRRDLFKFYSHNLCENLYLTIRLDVQLHFFSFMTSASITEVSVGFIWSNTMMSEWKKFLHSSAFSLCMSKVNIAARPDRPISPLTSALSTLEQKAIEQSIKNTITSFIAFNLLHVKLELKFSPTDAALKYSSLEAKFAYRFSYRCPRYRRKLFVVASGILCFVTSSLAHAIVSAVDISAVTVYIFVNITIFITNASCLMNRFEWFESMTRSLLRQFIRFDNWLRKFWSKSVGWWYNELKIHSNEDLFWKLIKLSWNV